MRIPFSIPYDLARDFAPLYFGATVALVKWIADCLTAALIERTSHD